MSKPPAFKPLSDYVEYPVGDMRRRARAFCDLVAGRRSVRDFSDRSVPRQVILDCLEAASTAPSGANLQPWHFVIVEDAPTKKHIREAAEVEEREFYERRAPQEWLDALAPLGTDSNKPFLERAPYALVPDIRRKALEDVVSFSAESAPAAE